MKRCVIILSNYILSAKVLDDPVILTASKDVESVMEMERTQECCSEGTVLLRLIQSLQCSVSTAV